MPPKTKAASTPRKVEPNTDRAILEEVRAIRADAAAHHAAMERHVIAGVRGVALIERHVRTYLEAFIAAGEEDAPQPNGKAPHASK